MHQTQLLFGGNSWPAAKVAARHQQFEFPETSSAAAAALKPVTFARIETTGRGRKWSTTSAAGFWRDFAELRLEDDEAIAGFVRRRGDPDSELSPDNPIVTRNWLALQSMLVPLARAWSPTNDISECVDGKRREHALATLELRGPLILAQKNVEPVLNRHGFGHRFRLLGDFMFASAADMLIRRARMRACVVCGSWFELQRSTRVVCSAGCNTRKQEIEGRRVRHGQRS